MAGRRCTFRYTMRLTRVNNWAEILMTDNTQTTVINVAVCNRDGQLYASSNDLFGLNICAKNDDELIERLKAGVKWLYRQNHDLNVEVMVPTSPNTFPRATNRVLEQLVVAAAA